MQGSFKMPTIFNSTFVENNIAEQVLRTSRNKSEANERKSKYIRILKIISFFFQLERDYFLIMLIIYIF